MLVIVLDEFSVMVEVRPRRIASTLLVGVMAAAVSDLSGKCFGGVVNATRRVSLLPYTMYALSLAARTLLVTFRYNGSFGVRKLTVTVKRLTMLVSGVKTSESRLAYVKRVSRAWIE